MTAVVLGIVSGLAAAAVYHVVNPPRGGGGVIQLGNDEVETAWGAASTCLIGEPLGPSEDAALRLRRVELAARTVPHERDFWWMEAAKRDRARASGMASSDPSWPRRCLPHLDALSDALGTSDDHAPLRHEVDRARASLSESGGIEEPAKLWGAAAALQLEAIVPEGIAPPPQPQEAEHQLPEKAPLPVIARLSLPELVTQPPTFAITVSNDVPRPAAVCQERASGLVCSWTTRRGFAGLPSLGPDAPLAYLADDTGGIPGIYDLATASLRLRIDGPLTHGAYVSSRGVYSALIEGDGRWLLAVSDGESERSHFLDEPRADTEAHLFGPFALWLVERDGGQMLRGRGLMPDGQPDAAADMIALDGEPIRIVDNAAAQLGCIGTSTLWLGIDNRLLHYAGGFRLLGGNGRFERGLHCGDDWLRRISTSHGGGMSGGHMFVSRVRCEGDSCADVVTFKRLNLPGRSAYDANGSGGDKALVELDGGAVALWIAPIWNDGQAADAARSRFGGHPSNALYVASAGDLAALDRAPARIAIASPERPQALRALHVLPAGDHAVVLLVTATGTHALRLDAGGKLTPLAVSLGPEPALPPASDAHREGCEAGVARSCAELAAESMKSDPERGFVLYGRACELGDGFACFRQGRLYDEGRGTSPNRALGLSAYVRACELGEDRGCLLRGLAPWLGGDHVGAAHWLRQIDVVTNRRRAPWAFVAMSLARQDPAPLFNGVAKPRGDSWSDRLLQLFIGAGDPAVTLAGIDREGIDARERDVRLCEGHFFIAMHHLLAERPDEARGHLEKAAAVASDEPACLAAKAELERLPP